MKLNHTDDTGMQLQKLTAAGNQIIELNKLLKESGDRLNLAKIAYIKDKNIGNKVLVQECVGEFARIKADIKTLKEVVNVLKMTIRAENNVSF